MKLYVEQHIPYSKCHKDRAVKIAPQAHVCDSELCPCTVAPVEPSSLSTAQVWFLFGSVFYPNKDSHFICYYSFFSVQFFILEFPLKVLTEPRYQNGCQMRYYLVLASEHAVNTLSNNIQDIVYQVMISLMSLSDVGHRLRVV